MNLFDWADEHERARLERASAEVISFEEELLERRPEAKRFASYVQQEYRMLARAAGFMPPAPILSLRRQA